MAGIENKISFEFSRSEIDPEGRERDIKNQEDFCSEVEQLRQSSIGLLPDLAGELNHHGQTTTEVEAALEKDPRQALISQRAVDYLSEKSLPDRTNFTPIRMFRLGREDSRQFVFFGELQGEWFHEATTEGLNVAVKPVPHDPYDRHKVLHEVAMYQHLAEQGIPTLEVLSVMKNNDSSRKTPYGYVITTYEPDVTTLDSLDWKKMENGQIAQSLEPAIDTLALLHSHYLFHGDSEFKNIAVVESGKSPKIVDLEFGASLRDEQENVLKLSQFMNNDFSCLARSLDLTVGHYYRNENGLEQPVKRYDFLFEHVFLPYYNKMQQLGVIPTSNLGKAYENVVIRKQEEALGNEGRWRHA